MPLNSDDVPFQVFEGFGDSVVCKGRHNETRCHVVDALMMVGRNFETSTQRLS